MLERDLSVFNATLDRQYKILTRISHERETLSKSKKRVSQELLDSLVSLDTLRSSQQETLLFSYAHFLPTEVDTYGDRIENLLRIAREYREAIESVLRTTVAS
jgi:DNA repair ATPase RecN